jgi:hypothetical protein
MQELFLFCFLLATKKTILNNSLNKDDITITKKQKQKNFNTKRANTQKYLYIKYTLVRKKKLKKR